MKTKKFFLMAAMLLTSVCTFAQSENNEPLKGDVNGDGKVDVADITAIVKIIMENGGGTAHNYTWYLGETEQESFTTADFNMTGTKPTVLNIGPSSGDKVTVWIYPQSWGKPTSIVDANNNDVTNVFIYNDSWMTIPNGYYGGWCQAQMGATLTLTWPETYYWYIGTTPITADNYQTLATQVSQYESEFMWTPAERAYVYALVTNDKIVQIIDPSFNVAVDTTVDTTSIKGYSIYKTATKIAVTPVKIKISPQTTYYWYVGTEQPSSSTNPQNNIASSNTSTGWRLIGNSLPEYSLSNKLLDIATNGSISIGGRVKYYIAVPSPNIKIYSTNGQDVTNASFNTLDPVTINNVTYTIYEYKNTAVNLGYDLY